MSFMMTVIRLKVVIIGLTVGEIDPMVCVQTGMIVRQEVVLRGDNLPVSLPALAFG